ncbi:MAG: VTT domain-containing protein, partial [Solirubrobacterales bacterium]
MLGIAVIVATVIAFLLQPSPDDLEDVFGGRGVIGPLLYASAYAVLTVFFVPGVPLTLAAGALYGVAGGFAVSMLGASVGAIGAFLVARRSAGDALEHGGGARVSAITKRLSGKGLFALLVLRLVPVVPFNALNYAAGVSTIGTRDYVLATVLGIAPGALAYTALGAGLDDPASPLFIGAAALAIGLAILARAFSRRSAGDPEEA